MTLCTKRGSAGCAKRGVRVVVQAVVRREEDGCGEGAHLIAACVRAASCAKVLEVRVNFTGILIYYQVPAFACGLCHG